MKLEKLTLANFRGFEQIDIQFEPDVTVIAGVNGMGKSTILDAIAKCTVELLHKAMVSLERPFSFSGTDIKYGKDGLTINTVTRFSDRLIITDVARSKDMEEFDEIALRKERNTLNLLRSRTKKGSDKHREYSDTIQMLDAKLMESGDRVTLNRFFDNDSIPHSDDEKMPVYFDDAVPIAVYYTTKRFLSKNHINIKNKELYSHALAQIGALNQVEISLNEFAMRYRVETESEDINRSDRFQGLVETAVSKILDGFSDLRLHTGKPPRFSVCKKGEILFLEQLSDGERGLLALVFDLSRRLAIANPSIEDPLADGIALVLIDEIELHLHPKWQREVISKLTKCFKNCQFIVTTHSPIVLSEVDASSIRYLEMEDNKVVQFRPTVARGMDTNRMLQELMDAPIRNSDVARQLSELFELIENDEFDKAHEVIDQLLITLGETEPELTRARTLMKFLESDE